MASRPSCQKKAEKLVGKSLGNWKVLKLLPEKIYSNYTFICQCKCGTKRLIFKSALEKGKRNACMKCWHKLRSGQRRKYQVGQKSDNWEIVEIRENGAATFKCLHCGANSDGFLTTVIKDNTKRCKHCKKKIYREKDDSKL